MHEAGVAAAAVSAIQRQAGPWSRVRLYVRDVHGAAEVFDQVVTGHIAGALPSFDTRRLEIVHLPLPRICSACAHRFESTVDSAPCPACGGAPLPTPHEHRAEIEFLP